MKPRLQATLTIVRQCLCNGLNFDLTYARSSHLETCQTFVRLYRLSTSTDRCSKHSEVPSKVSQLTKERWVSHILVPMAAIRNGLLSLRCQQGRSRPSYSVYKWWEALTVASINIISCRIVLPCCHGHKVQKALNEVDMVSENNINDYLSPSSQYYCKDSHQS